jgi:hypothetical protein
MDFVLAYTLYLFITIWVLDQARDWYSFLITANCAKGFKLQFYMYVQLEFSR